MQESIIIAIISFAGTLVGAWMGVLKANQLTNYRIQQLERKVDVHNTLIERTYKLEEQDSIFCEKLKGVAQRVEDLERQVS